MKRLIIVLAGLAVLAGCEKTDPTQKHDFSCAGPEFGSDATKAPACVQFRLLESEALAPETACTQKDGHWEEHGCPSTDRVPGTCQVDEISGYTISNTPAKVYFYTSTGTPVDAIAAEAACTAGEGTWIPAT
jgi:hypothetical protein